MRRLTDDEQIALDCIVHEVCGKRASEINNGGIEKQISFLKKEGWTETNIIESISEDLYERL